MRLLYWCRDVLLRVGITCFVFVFGSPFFLSPLVIPECGLVYLPSPLGRPQFVGRFVCCSWRSTLPEAVGGSWALDCLLHPPVLKEGGCRLRPIGPAEPHHPQDRWGGGSASTEVGGTLLSSRLSRIVELFK